MKNLKLLATLFSTIFLLISNTFGQQAVTLAMDFVQKLDNEKYEAAYDQLNAEVKEKISFDDLIKTWKTIETQCGNFRSFSDTKEQQVKSVSVVTLGGVFEKLTLNITITVEDDKIAGLFFAPRNPSLAHVAAPYDKKNYTEKELSLTSADCELSGLLTIPSKKKGKLPAVIFVHGSGPSDKDETIGPNKIFKDLSAGLAEKGIASYRYDKRSLTCVGTLLGNKEYTPEDEVINDVLQAVKLLKQQPGIDSTQIYIVGHSLGGMLAPQIAHYTPVKGIVLLNANARFLGETISDQLDYLYSLGNLDLETKNRMQAQLRLIETNAFYDHQIPQEDLPLGLPYSYWYYLKNYSQTFMIKTFNYRVLVINSGHDYQVPIKEFELWKATVDTFENGTVKLFPDLNHLLIKSPEMSKPSDYELPGNVAPEVIDYISKWIRKSE